MDNTEETKKKVEGEEGMEMAAAEVASNDAATEAEVEEAVAGATEEVAADEETAA